MSLSQEAKKSRRPKPEYIARAKVNGGWVNIGAAWPVRSGEDAFSVQLTTMPLNWDGRMVLIRPLPSSGEGEPE